MLPPDFAAFSFHVDADGADDVLASRTLAAARRGRVAVCGAGRWSLLVDLARRGAAVVAFDPSRLALRTARDALRMHGVADRVELYASDPRDVDVPGGAAAALVTSFAWRVLLTSEAQEQTIRCLAHAVEPSGALCIDVDRLPPSTPAQTEWTPLRRGPGGQIWRWRRDPTQSLVTVECDAPRVGPVEVALSDATPEGTADLLRAAGLVVEDAAAGSSARAFLVARRPGT